MSLVDYSTQIGPPTNQTQLSQSAQRVYLVYHDRMNQTQTNLMKDAQCLLSGSWIGIISESEIKSMPKQVQYYVISSLQHDLVKLIKSHAEKPIIYTARCVIEALKYREIKVPRRSLAVSLSMVDCKIFLVRSCNIPELRKKINEMCGTILADFDDKTLNVVISDKADDKYCARARARNVIVVSRDWVDETHAMSTSEDNLNHNALETIAAYQIKPFVGLKFKIKLPQLGKELRDLIGNNGGKLVFGNDETTHVVEENYQEVESTGRRDPTTKNERTPRVVDVGFLRACNELGYYMNRVEYREHRASPLVTVKQERFTQSQSFQRDDSFRSHDCFTPPQQNPRSTLSSIRSNGCERISENQSMPPPPSIVARSTHQQHVDTIDALIRKSWNMENATQTQMVSTQIRRLPEAEIRFERPPEPSQQLYWRENRN